MRVAEKAPQIFACFMRRKFDIFKTGVLVSVLERNERARPIKPELMTGAARAQTVDCILQ